MGRLLSCSVLMLGLCLSLGCAQGDEGEPRQLDSGVYQLSTLSVEGDCVLDDAITAGPEFAGKHARVRASSGAESLSLEVCDDFFEDECHPEAFHEPLGLLRDGDGLIADDPQWEVSACECFGDYRGSRTASGLVTDHGRAELTWVFDFPAPPASCPLCDLSACTATVTQRMASAP